MKIRAIVTGATGMVGEGVLHECLQHPDVEAVLVVNRKPCGVTHPKLKEIIHKDFFDLSSIAVQLQPFNACFFCLGVSSVGLKEPEFRHLTYDLTMHFAQTVAKANPDMTFAYISGAGTDSTAQGKVMWARVKGQTENDLLKTGFKGSYAFRPGFMKPTAGLKNTLPLYTYIGWMYPLLKKIFPASGCTLAEVGLSMINVAIIGYEKKVLEVKDIEILAHR